MEFSEALTFNAVGIVLVALLAFFLGSDRGEFPRWFVATWIGWSLTCMSAIGWLIYAIAHFVGKYW